MQIIRTPYGYIEIKEYYKSDLIEQCKANAQLKQAPKIRRFLLGLRD